MKTVLIVQEYVPKYRSPVFNGLRARLATHDIRLVLAAGLPSATLGRRGDAAEIPWITRIRQREIRVLGRRVSFRNLRRLVSSADLVVMEQARRNADIYFTLLKRKRPLIALWGHGVDRNRSVSRIESRVSRWLLSKADWFFAYTNGSRDAAIAQGFASNRIVVLQNAIDTSRLQALMRSLSLERLAILKQRRGLRGKTALYIGALDTYKRIDFLLEAAKRSFSLNRDFRLIIAGDGEDRQLVEAAARTLDYVQYVGAVDGLAKAELLALADVLVCPGSVGLGALDSFAAGVPLVLTQRSFHGPEIEYLDHGRNAVFTADSVQAFAAGIVATLDDPSLLEHLGRECKNDAAEYNVEEMLNRFEAGILAAMEEGKS